MTKERRFERMDEKGCEVVDPRPMQPPAGIKTGPSMMDRMIEAVRSETFRLRAEAAGFETFEESEDFDVPDDQPDPLSKWEDDFDPRAAMEELRRDILEVKKASGKDAEPPKDSEAK